MLLCMVVIIPWCLRGCYTFHSLCYYLAYDKIFENYLSLLQGRKLILMEVKTVSSVVCLVPLG